MNSKGNINTRSQKNLLQIIVSGILFLCALLAEIYWIVHKSEEVFVMLGLAFLLLIQGYFVVDGIRGEYIRNIGAIEEKYEELVRTQKASYIMSKNAYESINDKFDKLIGNQENPISEIVKNQKSIAKVTIKHNRQSMEELVRLNLQVLEELEKVSKIAEMKEDIKEETHLEKEKSPVEVKLYDDPNTNLTPEEIEALFLSMGK